MSIITIGAEDESMLPVSQRRANLISPPEDRGVGDTFASAFSRGVDSAQASAYAFAKTLGEAVGIDVVSKWADKGIESNIQEIMANPPEIRDWDDVDGFADFGTYVVEALGEQLPQLALQFAGAKGGGKLARAQLGKAMKRRLGEQAYANYKIQAAVKGTAEAQQMAKRAALGATLGAGAAGVTQNIGESKMNLDDAGVADNTGQALLGGAIKGALDTLAFGQIMKISERTGVDPSMLGDFLTKQAAKVGLNGAGTKLATTVAAEGVTDAAVEGATETAQTFVDQVLVHADRPGSDLFSEKNLSELRESFIKGGLLGGIIGSVDVARKEFPAYAQARREAGAVVADTIDQIAAPDLIGNANILPAPDAPAEPQASILDPVEPATPVKKATTLRQLAEQRQAASATPAVNTDAQILASQQADEHLAIGLGTLPPVARQQAIDAIQSGHPQAEEFKAQLRERGQQTLASEQQQLVANRAEMQGRTTVFKEDMVPAEDLAASKVYVPSEQSPINDTAFSTQGGVLEEAEPVTRPDPAVMPEPYTKTGLMPSEEVALAARYAGQRKAGMLQSTAAQIDSPAVQEVVANNTIIAVSPEGKETPISLTDLTYAGMNALSATKTSQELSEPEFRVRGLEYALGDMVANGWNVNGAFDDRGRLKQDLVLTVGNLKRSTPTADRDIRQVQNERDNRQFRTPADQYMPSLPEGAHESVRQQMASVIEDHQNQALDTIQAWAENPDGDLASLLGTTLRQRGEATNPVIAQLEANVRAGAYNSPQEILESPEVSELLAESENMRSSLMEDDYNPYSSDEARQRATDDSASEHQMAIAQDDNLQEADGTFKSRVREYHGDAAARDYLVSPKTKRLGIAEENIARIDRELKQLSGAQRDRTQPRSVNTLRERSDRIKALQAERRVAYKEMEDAAAEDRRLAAPGNKPVANRARVSATTNAAAAPIARYRAARDARETERQQLTAAGEDRGLRHITDAMNKARDQQTGAELQAARTTAQQAAFPGGTPDQAIRPDEYMQHFDAPQERTTVNGMQVFSSTTGVTRADAEFTAGLMEHFGMPGVTSLRIDESPGVKDVSVGVEGDQLVMVVPTLPNNMSAAMRQAKIAEALGRNIFNRYLRFDRDYLGPQKAQQYRAYIEKAYLQDTGKKSVDETAFRKWFGEKTAGYVQELVQKTKFTDLDENSRPKADPTQHTSKQMERKVPGISERPSGIADRVFRELAGRIYGIWKKNADKLARYRSNAAVSKFLERVVRNDPTSVWWEPSKVDPAKTAAPESVADKVDDASPPPPGPPPSGAGTTDEPPPSGPSAFGNILANSMDPAGWAGVRNLFSAGSQLRAAWEPLGLLIEQPTNTLVENPVTGKEAYHTAVRTHKDMFAGSMNVLAQKHLSGMTPARVQAVEAQAFRILTMGTDNAAFDLIRKGKTPDNLKHFDQVSLDFATDLHDMHDDMYRYAHKVNKKLTYVDGYFHRNYNLPKIVAEQEKFDAILARHGATGVYDTMIMNYLTRPDNGEPLSPPAKHMRSRKVHDQALLNDLVEAGFLSANPFKDLMSYTRNVVSRTEYDRLRPAIDAEFKKFKAHIDQQVQQTRMSREQGDAEIARVQGLLNNALGLTPVDKSSSWYRPLEELRALTSLNSLLFGGLAGITEGGAVLLKTRGQVAAKQFGQLLMDMANKTKRAELQRFAESMGVITSDMHAALGSQMFESVDSFDGPISKYIPKMLEYTGNEYMARMWRVVSAATAKQYLLNMAEQIQAGTGNADDLMHQLRELSPSLTPEMIFIWRDAGFPSWAQVERVDTPGNRALYTAALQVNHAISRFANETVVNPTAADAPPWSRNMYGAFLFQLKGFDMTAKKRVMMGAYREIQRQVAKGDMSAAAASAAAWAIPSALVLMALAGAQEEIRQRLRSMGEKGMVSAYHNDMGTLTKALTDRAGFTNIPFVGALIDPSLNTVAFEAGPTASKALQVGQDLQKGDAVAAALHVIPGVSQVPAAREIVYKALEETGLRG